MTFKDPFQPKALYDFPEGFFCSLASMLDRYTNLWDLGIEIQRKVKAAYQMKRIYYINIALNKTCI